ncbi:MAG: anti-sigma factor family protein [Oscillospiraceae bacterium]
MNCENALELMNRELDEALTAEESAALQAHLDACPDCRETWRQLHELDALLQESELEPPAALHEGVMRAIRQGQKGSRAAHGFPLRPLRRPQRSCCWRARRG